MKVAYADPPYPGQAKRHYGEHPDYAGEVNHEDLIARLEDEFPDGWALSTSANAIQEVLALCPKKKPSKRHYHAEESGVHVAVWVVTNSAPCPPLRRWHSWEPVIVRGGRTRQRHPQDLVRDSVAASNRTPGQPSFRGAKPTGFCYWLFELLGLERDDEFVDLFPGSGAVGRAWETWRTQLSLLEGAA